MIAHANTELTAVATGFVNSILGVIIFPLVVLMLVLALVVFLYGCFEYVVGANDSTARATGGRHIFYGLIGLLVMISAYAILTIAATTFGIGVPNAPGF